MNEITFTKVKLPYGWLGNMSPHPVHYREINYPTAEALFQALRFENLSIRRRIAAERNPMSAKMLAKSLAEQMTVKPLTLPDIENMRLVLQLKTEQHPDLCEKLLATGDARIIEDVTARQRGSALFWGAARINGKWSGENTLGKLWVECRDILRT